MKRNWIYQSYKEKNCGQIAVSVITGKSLDEITKMIGHSKGTTTKELVKVLRSLGYVCPDRCKPMKQMPKLAIAQMKNIGRKYGWHWVVIDGKKIYDGQCGKSDGTVNWNGGKITSYLPITEPNII